MVVVALLLTACPPLLNDPGFQGAGIGVTTAGTLLTLSGGGVVDAGLPPGPGWVVGRYVSPVFDFSQWSTVDRLTWSTLRPSGVAFTLHDAWSVDSIDPRDVGAVYHLDEPSWSSAIVDASPNANHATGTASATAGPASALFGLGAHLDGDTCLVVPHHPSLTGTPGFAVSVWFKLDADDASAQGLIAKRVAYTSGTEYSLFVEGQHLSADVDTENNRATGGTFITSGVWHHAVLTFDGGRPTTQRLELWLDGVLEGQYPEDSSALTSYGSPLHLGCIPDPNAPGTRQGLKGVLDDVVIFLRPLTAGEVASLYRRGAGRVRFETRGCQQPGCADDPPWRGASTAPTALIETSPASLGFSAPFGQYRALLQGEPSQPYPEVIDVAFEGTCSPDAGVDGGDADGGAELTRRRYSLVVANGCSTGEGACVFFALLFLSRRLRRDERRAAT